MFGPLSDRIGRRGPVAVGMALQGAGLGLLAVATTLPAALTAATILGLGTGMAYPVLIALVADRVAPAERATALGIYRFFRDGGYAVGALVAGVGLAQLGAATAWTGVAFVPLAILAWRNGAGTDPADASVSRRAKLAEEVPVTVLIILEPPALRNGAVGTTGCGWPAELEQERDDVRLRLFLMARRASVAARTARARRTATATWRGWSARVARKGAEAGAGRHLHGRARPERRPELLDGRAPQHDGRAGRLDGGGGQGDRASEQPSWLSGRRSVVARSCGRPSRWR
ncbi:MAG: MFS transporter [Trueperaceae bacterium]|nr:MFS transporter [Trueperaceae bacterium]